MNFIEIMKNLIADVASSKLKSMKKMKIKERAEKEREREKKRVKKSVNEPSTLEESQLWKGKSSKDTGLDLSDRSPRVESSISFIRFRSKKVEKPRCSYIFTGIW